MSFTSVAFLISGILVLAGKGDRFIIGKKDDSEKFYIKRLRIVWGMALILVAVLDIVKDFFKYRYYYSIGIGILLLIVALILQNTWAKKKDSES